MKKSLLLSIFLMGSSLQATVDLPEDTTLRVSKHIRHHSKASSPLSKTYLKGLVRESLQKMVDIFDDNLKKGAGTSEVRLCNKLMSGSVTLDQLQESSQNRYIGQMASTVNGSNFKQFLSYAFPEHGGYIEDPSMIVPIKRPGYLMSSVGLMEKSFGALVFKCIQDPTLHTFEKELPKVLKSFFVAFGMAMAGQYYQTYAPYGRDYLEDECGLAASMAVGGAVGHFVGSLTVEIAKHYSKDVLERSFDLLDTYEASLKKHAKVLQKTFEQTTADLQTRAGQVFDELSTFAAPESPKKAPTWITLMHKASLQASYEMGSYLGEMLYTFNNFGSPPSLVSDTSGCDEARHSFGSLSVAATQIVWNTAALVFSRSAAL